MTFNDLKQDAEKALNVLMAQPEVNDTKKITIIGGFFHLEYLTKYPNYTQIISS